MLFPRLILILSMVAPVATARPTFAAGPFAVAKDTLLTDSIRTGGVLIRSLPDRISGRVVEAYESIRVPATGWLHDRSFFWRVPIVPAGEYQFVFGARLRGGARDTVLVSVRVTPSGAPTP